MNKAVGGISYRLIIGLSIIALLLAATQQVLASGAGYTWTSRSDAAGSRQWQAIASSTNGQKLVSVVNNGYIYTSTDAGVTWTEQTNSGSRQWVDVASSADGTKLAAMVHNGRIYTSTDSGVNWAVQANSKSTNWFAIASSADGTRLVGVEQSGNVFTSTDSGVNWTERTAPGEGNYWISIALSADGTKIALPSRGGDHIYTSSDFGANWVQQTGSGERNWYTVDMSPDGTKLVAAESGGYIYKSNDSGVTWTALTGAGSRGWGDVAMSDDGTKIIALGWSVGVYTTIDAGTTWTTETGAGVRTWGDVTISADGSHPVAVAYNNYIYTAYDPTLDTTLAPEEEEDEDVVSDVPNSGDANNDGVQDDTQTNVSTFKSSVSNKFVVLEVNDACTVSDASMKHIDDIAGRDGGYEYPNGLMDFDVNCGDPGFTATISQYYYDITKESLTLRKYMPTTNAFFTINGAQTEQLTIDGRTVTKATYQVTDGGALDVDGVANGVIVDPAGLGRSAVGTPNTGIPQI